MHYSSKSSLTMAHPLFSIITVTYNAAETIERTVASVLEQTFDDYEHLIIDGASKDNTLALIEAMPDPHRSILSEPDRGLYDAMNKGLSIAQGKYVIFLNSGDRFHSPEVLEMISERALSEPTPGVIYGQTDIVDTEGHYIGPRHLRAPENLTLKSFAEGMVVCHQAFVALRRITGRFNPGFRFSADYLWCIHCLQHSRHNAYVDATLIDYLRDGLSTANRRRSLYERFRIMCRYYGVIPTMVRHLRFIPRFIKNRRRGV